MITQIKPCKYCGETTHYPFQCRLNPKLKVPNGKTEKVQDYSQISLLTKSKGDKPRKGIVKQCPNCNWYFYVSRAFATQVCCSYICESESKKGGLKLIEGEIVRPLIAYPHYYVSSLGRVFSDAMGFMQVKTQSYNKHRDYWYVSLRVNRHDIRFHTSRLVAAAFLENPNNLPEVNHKDGNRNNNNLSNLEWISKSGNIRHSYDVLNRVRPRGELAGNVKLTRRQVEEIKLLKGVKSYREIAERYRVKYSTIAHIMRGSRWSYDSVAKGSLSGNEFMAKRSVA